jgi:hypothetical protein
MNDLNFDITEHISFDVSTDMAILNSSLCSQPLNISKTRAHSEIELLFLNHPMHLHADRK